jgi:O-antigen ligase
MLAAGLLLCALVLGGGPGPGNIVVQALAGAALAHGALRWRKSPPDQFARGMNWLLLASTSLVLIQLLPLPVDVYMRLPQRAGVVADIRAAGLAPGWMPLTLDRPGTLRALLALEAFAGMWLLAGTLSMDARVRLLKLALAAGILLAVIGFAQASAKLDTTGANATFANRNHFASLMAMLVPVGFAVSRHQRESAAGTLLGYSAVVVLLLAAALSYSRAGSLLALYAAIASVAAMGGRNQHPHSHRATLAALASLSVAGAVVAFYAWDRLGARFGSNVASDLRWDYWENGIHALRAYMPWGSGLGSFRWVYQGFEPTAGLGEFTYAVHAHNELLELGIEAGVAGLLLAIAFLALLAKTVAGIRASPERPWPTAAAIACSVPLLHSLVDFPLRTQACGITLALLLSVMRDSIPRHR